MVGSAVRPRQQQQLQQQMQQQQLLQQQLQQQRQQLLQMQQLTPQQLQQLQMQMQMQQRILGLKFVLKDRDDKEQWNKMSKMMERFWVLPFDYEHPPPFDFNSTWSGGSLRTDGQQGDGHVQTSVLEVGNAIKWTWYRKALLYLLGWFGPFLSFQVM